MSDILVSEYVGRNHRSTRFSALSARGGELLGNNTISAGASRSDVEDWLVFFANEGASIEFSADPAANPRRAGYLLGLSDTELLKRKRLGWDHAEREWIKSELVRRQHCAERRSLLSRAAALVAPTASRSVFA